MTATPHLTNGAPDGQESISDLQSLTRDYYNDAGQVVQQYAYFNLNGLTYTIPPMGTRDTNYYETDYVFDSDGRLYQTETDNGTWYRTVYNSLGEAVSDWVATAPTAWVEIASYQYDADGNLIFETDMPGLGEANRVIQYWYDWRDRLAAEKDGVENNENDGVNRPHYVYTYDNLDEVTETQQYLGDGVTPQFVDGVLDLSGAQLVADEVDNYDEQGRVYQTPVYDVNPSTGTKGDILITNYYYDHRRNLMAESDPGGLWTKSVYDGAGRDVMDYTTDGAGGWTWADAASVANDTVLEQEQTVYDGDGNVIETIDSQRFHNTTGTGPLGTPTSLTDAARVYYAANYYDNADRLIASVDAGTSGGTPWSRPSSVPTSSPTLLVTQYHYTYTSTGLVEDDIDPMGIDTQTYYDNLGRVTKNIQDANGSAVTTEYGYDGNDNVVYVQADNSDGTHQKTAYLYGVTTASGSGVNSDDILSAIQYPDPSTGDPSSSPQETETYVVNALGDVVQSTDRNGTTHSYTHDVLGRVTSDAVTALGANVDGSVRRMEYAYDSQGNLSLITSYDAASGGNIVKMSTAGCRRSTCGVRCTSTRWSCVISRASTMAYSTNECTCNRTRTGM